MRYPSLLAMAGIAALLVAQSTLADTSSILTPTGNGAYSQWTPSTGSSRYVLVDESPCNGTTDYNYTNTVGNRESYAVSLASVPNAYTITDIAIVPCASLNKSGGGTGTLNVFYRFNATNSADAGAYALSGTTPVQLTTTTFSGLNLVKGPSSTLQIGAVLSAGTKGARLSRIATVLTYTYIPLNAPTDLSATSASSTQNNLSWTDASTNEAGFKIERGTTGEAGPFTFIATTTANVASYADRNVTGGTTYYYRVRSYNAGEDSVYSNVASTTTP